MRGSKLVLSTILLAIALLGLGGGWLLAGLQPTGASPPNPNPAGTVTPTSASPGSDVQGVDLVDLPRFPGSVRVEYRRVLDDRLLITEAEYVVSTQLSAVHDFYRGVFSARGWLVADLDFFQGERTFFLISGDTEAVVEIEARGPLVEIELELSEPHPGVAPSCATGTSAPAAPTGATVREPTPAATRTVEAQAPCGA